MRGWAAIAGFAASMGCGPTVATPDAGDTSSGPGPSSSAGESTPPFTSTTGDTSTTGGGSTSPATFSTVDPDDGSEGDGTFIIAGETICSLCWCSVWDQNCPRGEKCSAWSNDGGTVWNAVRCVPLDDDPDMPGEPCTVEDSPVSGVDSCALGSMCWNVDVLTNVGECVELCMGSEDAPVCPPSTSCLISNEGVLNLCLPSCDPILADCDAGQQCMLVTADAFFCVPAGAGEGYGEPCQFSGACGPGLACAPSTLTPGIGNCSLADPGCCTAYCDLGASDPDAACPDVALGQTCAPYFEAGAAPAGYEHVGICVVDG